MEHRDAGGEALGLGGRAVAQLARERPPDPAKGSAREIPAPSSLRAHTSVRPRGSSTEKPLLRFGIPALVSWSPDLSSCRVPAAAAPQEGELTSASSGGEQGAPELICTGHGHSLGQRSQQPSSRANLEQISHGQELPNPFPTDCHPAVERRKEVGRI